MQRRMKLADLKLFFVFADGHSCSMEFHFSFESSFHVLCTSEFVSGPDAATRWPRGLCGGLARPPAPDVDARVASCHM